MQITLETAKAIYRQAIDPSASDSAGAAWWDEVADEVRDVVAARTIAIAAELIAWWHHDWTSVNDTPRMAATRIRNAARMTRPGA
ncbi:MULTISPECIES: hypothetical protein [Burkholderia]|uniref:hypothetical protein n=1 Tax=Burkholderia TaxID=32008 RepID=UPI000B7AAAE3|nr:MULTISPECIES: hypothetical protein [Burkholderia]MBR7944634.1 hypothetical protein [Burkholderia cenocepacia]OXJ22674.1 hypothetical protein CFB82_39085 [Burkholderia sp. HI2714]CAG2383029.1 hypothetical protein BCCR12632_07211 [Burkholderia cenocepacia]CAG2383033.1 hypothetical protein BCCR75389_07168 [Burkholderia cenocepacia]CAG2383045.1 hypothetical protein BCCR75388_07176 [Burkholderia cenocepacia]